MPSAVNPVFDELRSHHADNDEVGGYLERMQTDIIDNAAILFQAEGGRQQADEQPEQAGPAMAAWTRAPNRPHCNATGAI